MKYFIGVAMLLINEPTFAHGQVDHSFIGSPVHHLTAFDHTGLIWVGIALVFVALNFLRTAMRG